jgi:hypothetical protein
MSYILEIAKRRVDALLADEGTTQNGIFVRRDMLRHAIETRGCSAVALEELRLLDEVCMDIEADWEGQAKAEQDAENGWLRAAEAGTADDYAFEQYEAQMGLS